MNTASDTKVLVLDDDPLMLMLMKLLLRQMGLGEAATCDNGPEGLRLVDDVQQRPQLIFCDLHMPGMDGMEFARQLGERRYDGSLVLVSGEDESVLQAVRQSMVEHRIHVLGSLQKPVAPKALAALLEGWRG